MKTPKIVFLDIETLMIPEETLARIPSYGAYPGRGFNGTVSSILCFGYKINDGPVKIINNWDYKGWKKNVNDDKDICKDIINILDGADAIVTQNGKKFDIPVINARLAKHGMPLISKKIKHIDTRNVFRANVSAYDNKLDTIAKTFNCETKLENGGWQLWMDMYKNIKKSKDLMAKYCKQDVNVLHQVYIKMLPLINEIPNYNAFSDGSKRVCSNCGDSRLHAHGDLVTKVGKFKRYRCQSCGTANKEVKPYKKFKIELVKD